MKKTLYYNKNIGVLHPFNIVTKKYTKIFHEDIMEWLQDYNFYHVVDEDHLILEYK